MPAAGVPPACAMCGDLRLIECAACHGFGGFLCVTCAGHGVDEDGERCRTCNGRGAMICLPCRGEGGIECPRCAFASSDLYE